MRRRVGISKVKSSVKKHIRTTGVFLVMLTLVDKFVAHSFARSKTTLSEMCCLARKRDSGASQCVAGKEARAHIDRYEEEGVLDERPMRLKKRAIRTVGTA